MMKPDDQLQPSVFGICGGAGDWTWRKLVPALFDLFQDRSIPADFAVIAADREVLSDEKLRRRLHDGDRTFSRQERVTASEWEEFSRHIRYPQDDFKKLHNYAALDQECAKRETEWSAKVHRIFYRATTPGHFSQIPQYLGQAGLARDTDWTQIHLRSEEMPFNYQGAFAVRSPDAYEKLLWDVMKNDATLFRRADQVEAAWWWWIPVLEVCAPAPPRDFPNYAAGTWGPEDAQGVLTQGHN